MDIENKDKDNEKKLPSLGQRLNDARENLGLSIDEIGRKLCLRNTVVLAMEADEKPSNISDVFWRGYIRTYAKCVKIKEDEINILMADLAMPTTSSSVEKLMQFSQNKQRKQRDNWLKIFTILIIIVVIGLSVMWWWQKEGESTKIAPVETMDSIAVIATQPTTNFKTQSPTTQAQSASKEKLEKAIESTVTTSASNVNVSNEPENSIAISEDESQKKQHEEIQKSVQLADTQVPSEEISTDARGSGVNQTVKNNKLVISFTNDCWVRVLDEKNNKVLYSGLKKSGDMLNFNLDVDYEVKLGVPTAASVVFNENSVDLSDYIKNKRVATLKLKAQE